MKLEFGNLGSVGAADVRWEKEADLETALARAMEDYAPLVALGRPGEQEGAGRILTDEDKWKDEIDILAKRALLVFLVPSDRPGTLWEIDFIVSRHMLRKTIFMMPQKGGGINWSEKWREIVQGTHLLLLPPYEKRGAVFCFNEDGSIDIYKQMRSGLRALAMDINEILLDMSDDLKKKHKTG
jgi:hypothetical protein